MMRGRVFKKTLNLVFFFLHIMSLPIIPFTVNLLLPNHMIMLPSTIAILSLLLRALLWSLTHLRRHHAAASSQLKLPPAPPALPIIGNLHMLGHLPHRSLQQLAKKYGDIMSLRLGNVPTIVVSSPQAAELFFKTHDTIFASRPKVQASEYMSYGTRGLVMTPYGPYWRSVRRFCTMELLSRAKIDGFESMRREEIELVVQSLKKFAGKGEIVNISVNVGELIVEMTCRMVFGQSKDERFDIKNIVHEYLRLSGAFNIADYVPLLGILDLQGLTRSMKATSRVIDQMLEKIIDEHGEDCSGQETHHKDFIDLMLSLMNKSINSNDDEEKSNTIDRTNIKAIILDMLAGAIDTSAAAIEWAISELLKHPRVMTRLQEELENVVGINRMVEEADLAKLIYLDMVVKESLRLHPVAPLLVPHESMEDIMINGYYIPRKSRIIINTWAIGRDPNVWSNNAGEFFPERFADSNIDLRGRDFQLLPFGSGRRGCPGMHLGLTNIRLVLAQLVHCFDWELPHGMSPNDLDMTEKFGLSMSRANHLLAMPTYRLLAKNL